MVYRDDGAGNMVWRLAPSGVIKGADPSTVRRPSSSARLSWLMPWTMKKK